MRLLLFAGGTNEKGAVKGKLTGTLNVARQPKQESVADHLSKE